jgi:uncharacterized membrane protein YbaN (DUF454 family)
MTPDPERRERDAARGPARAIGRVLSLPARLLFLSLAVVSLFLAVLGVFLPLLPTVPFVLLAAWAAARSSPRLERALLDHPRFGPALRDWRLAGVVRRPAKVAASIAMAVSASIVLLVVPNRWAQAAALGCMAAVLLWLWRRPERAAEP